MRITLAAALIAGTVAALAPLAPASASCLQIEGYDRCISLCPASYLPVETYCTL